MRHNRIENSSRIRTCEKKWKSAKHSRVSQIQLWAKLTWHVRACHSPVKVEISRIRQKHVGEYAYSDTKGTAVASANMDNLSYCECVACHNRNLAKIATFRRGWWCNLTPREHGAFIRFNLSLEPQRDGSLETNRERLPCEGSKSRASTFLVTFRVRVFKICSMIFFNLEFSFVEFFRLNLNIVQYKSALVAILMLIGVKLDEILSITLFSLTSFKNFIIIQGQFERSLNLCV